MSGEATRAAVHLLIEGRVQGVWFRAWMQQEAQARGLDGWVRNRVDGRVEAVLAGAPELVEEMVRACRRGPAAARVANVARRPESDPVAPGFRLRNTV